MSIGIFLPITPVDAVAISFDGIPVMSDANSMVLSQSAIPSSPVKQFAFPLFATTTSKKLARFCVALASLIMSVDENFENIIVNKDVVDFIVSYLIKIYTSPVFKLDVYAKEYRSYSEYNDEDVKNLQGIYSNNSTFIDFLATQSRTSRSNLLSISGIESSKFSSLFNKMVHYKFIRINTDNVYPTDKFRKVYNLINKDFKTDIGNKVENSVGVEFINDLV